MNSREPFAARSDSPAAQTFEDLFAVPSLQDRARSILDSLRTTHTPVENLHFFTVGDSFRASLYDLRLRINELISSPRVLERIVLGNYGSGKTHFLNYLGWLGQHDFPDDAVICRVDLSKVHSAKEVEYQFFLGMQMVRNPHGHLHVLRWAYDRIAEQLLETSDKSPKSDEILHIFGTILLSTLNQVAGKWLPINPVEIAKDTGLFRKMADFIFKKGKSPKKTFDAVRAESVTQNIEFVTRYLQLVQKPDLDSSTIAKAAKVLAEEGVLMDLMFKVLKLARTKFVLILIDEIETLDREGLPGALVKIRDFRDRLGLAISRGSAPPVYPSVAMICACTEVFFDKIGEEEPALYSRWEGKELRLERFSGADIDYLVFKLRELYNLAGYRLKPVANSGADHAVIELRSAVLGEFATDETMLSTRRLIRRLIEEIDDRWLVR